MTLRRGLGCSIRLGSLLDMALRLSLALPAAGLVTGEAGLLAANTPDPCPPLQAQRPFPSPPGPPPSAAGVQPEPTAGSGSPSADYRHRLQTTPLGWARRDHWCVWIEPGAQNGPAALWDGRWRQAVEGALKRWAALLPITVVHEPSRAQVRLLRRKPPLQQQRASHGRATLAVVEVQRGEPSSPSGSWQIEPQVTVLLSPGQGEMAMQATALHELGHAFGLWGHSDHPGDALAAKPGSQPVLELSPRDRATLRWLQAQPGLMGPSGELNPGEALPVGPPAPAAPGAN